MRNLILCGLCLALLSGCTAAEKPTTTEGPPVMTLEETGAPRLLADCANDVIEADVNGDDERELLWFYHGGRDIFYLFPREEAVHLEVKAPTA